MIHLASWACMAAALFQGATPIDTDQFLAEFTKARQGVQCLQGRFEQTNKSGPDVVTVNGTVTYVNPRRILFKYESQEQNATYLIDNQKVFEYEPDVRQVQIYDQAEKANTEIFFLGFNNNMELLRQHYDLMVVEPEKKDVGNRVLVIHPKNMPDNAKPEDQKETSAFREVLIVLREKDYIPVAIQIFNQDTSEVLIRIDNIVLRDKADLTLATIAVPEGTKIFENDEKKEVVGAGGKVLPDKNAQPATTEPGRSDSPETKPASPVKVEDLTPTSPPAQTPAQKP